MQDKALSEQVITKRNLECKKLRDVPGDGDCFYIAAILQLLCDPVTSPYDTFKKRFDALPIQLKEFKINAEKLHVNLLQKEIEQYYGKDVKFTPENLESTPQLALLVKGLRQYLVNHIKTLIEQGNVTLIYTLLDDYHFGLEEEEQKNAILEKLNKHLSDRYYADAVMMQAFCDELDCSLELYTFNREQNSFENTNHQFEKEKAGTIIQIAHVNGEDPLIENPRNHYARFASPRPILQQTLQTTVPVDIATNNNASQPDSDSSAEIEKPVIDSPLKVDHVQEKIKSLVPPTDLEQLRIYADKTEQTNPLYSQALLKYINITEEALNKNRNNAEIVDQLNKTSSSVKAALQENNPQALLDTASKAYSNVSLPQIIGMAICGCLCILAGLVGIGLAAASIAASHGLSTPIALWSTSICTNLMITGGSLLASGGTAYGFFSKTQDKDAAKAIKEVHDTYRAEPPLTLN